MSRARDIFEKLKAEGEAAIDELLSRRVSEELFLDFKQSATHGKGAFADKDRKNLAKAISGFGNSEGGVIVWGVDCRPNPERGDVAGEKVPLENPERFKSWLEGAVSGCTVPPHGYVEHGCIPSAERFGYGFVVTLIPAATNLPLQSLVDHHYHMRSGSNFVHIPHAVLAGMFGRPPAPALTHFWDVISVKRNFQNNVMVVSAALLVRNEGSGIAREPFVTVQVVHKLGNDCDCKVTPVANEDWHHPSTFGRLYSVMSKDHVRIPPGGVVAAFNVGLTISQSPKNALALDCRAGCANGAPHSFRVYSATDLITQVRNDFMKEMPTASHYNEKKARVFGRAIFEDAKRWVS